MKTGTAYRSKIVPPEYASLIAERLRADGKTIVLVAGTYNPFRDHHDDLYRQASEFGSVFAATNSDRSLRIYRATQKRNDFIFPLWYRLKRLAECPHITYVTWYDDVNTAEALRNIKPAIFFRGPDYSEGNIDPVERAIAAELGIANIFARDHGKRPFSKADLNRHIADLKRAVREGHKFNPYALKVFTGEPLKLAPELKRVSLGKPDRNRENFHSAKLSG